MKRILLLSFVIMAVAIVGCKQTEFDIECEKVLMGYWDSVNAKDSSITDMPMYYFGDSAVGATRLISIKRVDTCAWDIYRRQINIYYEESVNGYYVGYNQYNSRSLIHVEEFTDTLIHVAQLYSSGWQTDYYLKRITPEKFYEGME